MPGARFWAITVLPHVIQPTLFHAHRELCDESMYQSQALQQRSARHVSMQALRLAESPACK